jgi:hypothetical protein
MILSVSCFDIAKKRIDWKPKNVKQVLLSLEVKKSGCGLEKSILSVFAQKYS